MSFMVPTDIAPKKNILEPQSVAIIGASRDPGKIGSQILTNIIQGGYQGNIYPINLNATEIQGLKAYPSVNSVPEEIDLAVIAIPAPYVPQVISECTQKKITAAVIISAGFKEIGEEGLKLENEVKKIAEEGNMHVIGPNCLGFINTDISLNATFSATNAKKGNLVLFSQSGAFGTAILDWANEVNLGFKHFVSLGNKVDVDENFLIEMWNEYMKDSNQSLVFAGYLEDIKDGRKFMQLSSKLSKKCPIVILKPGKSQKATQAISSHTGSMATEDIVVEAALKQAGCIRVNGISEMFDTLQILARQSIPSGNSVAIVTNAGGPGVAATDQVEDSILEMADLDEATEYTLQHQLPQEASVHNPIDVMGDAKADRYDRTIESVILDNNVDSIITLLTPQAVTEVEQTASVITQKYRKYPFKPIVAAFIGGQTTQKGIDILNQNQMPIFKGSEEAISALSNAYKYRQVLNGPVFKLSKSRTKSKSRSHAEVLLSSIRGKTMVGPEAEELVVTYGVNVPKTVFLEPDQAPPQNTNVSIGFPVVVKIISHKMLHKTEFSAVKLGIKEQAELDRAIEELNDSWKQHFGDKKEYKIQIQKMINGETLIIGFKRDPNFGPVIVFGAGGIFTELFKDTAQIIAPISKEQASRMVKDTKIYQILKGYRGKQPYDVKSLVSAIMNVSQIAIENPEIEEFDINPFIVLNEGAGGYAADVKIIKKE